jgi:hypothetical protein
MQPERGGPEGADPGARHPGSSRSTGSRSLPLLLALVSFSALPARATAAQDEPPPTVQYRIEARVDGPQKRLAGKETLLWRNSSSAAVADLWFHLYWNGFANNRSTQMWESRGLPRNGTKPVEDGWGWQLPTAIRVGGVDMLARLTWQAPDDARSEDRSVFSIALDSPVLPGESVEVAIDWDAQIPRVRKRTGYKDDFLFMGQWFPKVGVYEDGRGWNCHQFHSSTEFFADYGTYDVTIDLPSEYAGKVGGSGVQVESTLDEAQERVRTRFLAPSLQDRTRVDATGKRALVHDFAWTADPDYVVHQGTFYYDEWASLYDKEVARVSNALGAQDGGLRQRDVRVNVMMQPEHDGQWRRQFDATCTALFFYGLWFGEYPYEQVTSIDPAWGGSAAGGMEYPTLFTSGTRAFNEQGMQSPESVTVHECGHQFWYGLVGNNEFEAAWMDEGFNSYSTSEAVFRRYGERRSATWYCGLPKWGVRPASLPGGGICEEILTGKKIELGDLRGLLKGRADIVLEPLADSGFLDWWREQPLLTFVEERTDPRWSDRQRVVQDPRSDPVLRSGWEYVDSASYRTNSYSRPAVILRSLPALVGQDAFLRGMRHYSETWRYRHPYPADFVSTFSEGAGTDLSWYFDAVLGTTDTVDWSVDVQQKPLADAIGFFQGQDGAFALVERPKSEKSDATESTTDASGKGADGETNGKEWRYDVVVRRRGGLELPVKVRVSFADGSTRDFEWTRDDQAAKSWLRLPLETGAVKIVSVLVDPPVPDSPASRADRLWWLDEDMSNNQWYDQKSGDHLAPLRWTERVLTQYSHLLQFFASTGG